MKKQASKQMSERARDLLASALMIPPSSRFLPWFPSNLIGLVFPVSGNPLPLGGVVRQHAAACGGVPPSHMEERCPLAASRGQQTCNRPSPL
eukprot:213098-Chlamydomonas_euryale.AAC.4